jgi:hypothetical protein
MSNVPAIVIPLVTGIGGLVVGAGFARVTTRNDVRRQRYSDALAAFEHLLAEARDGTGPSEQAKRDAAELGYWLELDSVPVSNAYRTLIRTAAARPLPDEEAIATRRGRFVDVAHAYSSWRLHRRYWLQVTTGRDGPD